MKQNLFVAGILASVVVSLGSTTAVVASAETEAHFSQAQLKKMVHEAHTPEQYTTLANYYDQQQKHFAQEATEEKAEWARRSQYTQSIEAKYPRPVDTARNLYEYYAAKAAEAAALSAKYSQLATPDVP